MTDTPALTDENSTIVEKPLVAMFTASDGDIVCDIYPSGHSYQDYGMLICDLVRNVAGAFEVDEDAVWKWVDKERRCHTSELIAPIVARGTPASPRVEG